MKYKIRKYIIALIVLLAGLAISGVIVFISIKATSAVGAGSAVIIFIGAIKQALEILKIESKVIPSGKKLKELNEIVDIIYNNLDKKLFERVNELNIHFKGLIENTISFSGFYHNGQDFNSELIWTANNKNLKLLNDALNLFLLFPPKNFGYRDLTFVSKEDVKEFINYINIIKGPLVNIIIEVNNLDKFLDKYFAAENFIVIAEDKFELVYGSYIIDTNGKNSIEDSVGRIYEFDLNLGLAELFFVLDLPSEYYQRLIKHIVEKGRKIDYYFNGDIDYLFHYELGYSLNRELKNKLNQEYENYKSSK